MNEEVQKILDGIRVNHKFGGITRLLYRIDSLEIPLQVVSGIGRERNPKFVIDEDNRFAYENLILWMHGDSRMRCLNPDTKQIMPGDVRKGIYIAGQTGSGKSRALQVMNLYGTIDNVCFFSDGIRRRLHWTEVRAADIFDRYKTTGDIENLKSDPVLCIQDFGSEPTEGMYMGNRIEVLRQLIESRGDRSDLMTLITSNYSLRNEELRERYGERVKSRLYEMCNYLEISGKDRRMQM